MYRGLLIAGSALAVAIALLIAIIVVQDRKQLAENRRIEQVQRKTVPVRKVRPAKPARPVPPSPLPPEIDPVEVARLVALDKPREPEGHKEDYTWQQIEDKLQTLRSERKERPQALDDLDKWYSYLANPSFTVSDSFPEHLAKMSAWRSELPNSTAAVVVLAQIHMNHAWEARGSGSAGTVSPEGWQLFHERIATTEQLLDEAIESGVQDGQAYMLMVNVAKAEGWPRSRVQAVLEAGQKVDPTYGGMYLAMADYLLPRWHGEPGDIEAFVGQVAQSIPGDDGLEIYGRIAFIMNQYEPQLLFYGKYDRKLLGQAAVVVAQRHPAAPNLVPFAALCTVAAQDHRAARRVRPFVQRDGDVTRVPGWPEASQEYFQWCDAREVPTGEADWIWATHSTYGNIAFDSDSRFIWCGQGGSFSPVALLDTEEKEIHLELDGPSGHIDGLTFDREKKWLAAAILGTHFQGWVLWNTKSPDEPLVRQTKELPRAIAISPTSNELAIGMGQAVQVIDVKTGEELRTLDVKTPVRFLKYSGDGKLLAIDESVWDPSSGERRFDAQGIYVGFDSQQRSLARFVMDTGEGPNSQLYAYLGSSQNPEVLISDLGSHTQVSAISPDGTWLAFADAPLPGGAEGIKVWNLSTRKLHKRLGGHWNHIGAMAFSNDGKKLASIALSGGPIKIWSLED